MGNGGFAEMEPAAIEQAGQRLASRSQTLAQGWRNQESTIAGMDSAIGDDLLGATFRGVYTPERAAAQAVALTVPAMMQRDADVATTSAALYTDADLRSAAKVQGAQTPGASPV